MNEELQQCKICLKNRPKKSFGNLLSCKNCRNYYNLISNKSNKAFIFKLIACIQGNKCAICLKAIPLNYAEARGFGIDHCHESGKIRGILCHSCNIALGNLKDSVKLLYNAIKYLRDENNKDRLMKLFLGEMKLSKK